MIVNVLRRAAAMIGVVVMLPIGLMLATGQLSAADAGIRAGITLLAVLAVRRIAGYLGWLDQVPQVAPMVPAAEEQA